MLKHVSGFYVRLPGSSYSTGPVCLHRPVLCSFLSQGEVSSSLAVGGNICAPFPRGGGCCMGKSQCTAERLHPPELLSSSHVENIPDCAVASPRRGQPAWRPPAWLSWYSHPQSTVTSFHLTPAAWGECHVWGSATEGESRMCWAPRGQLLLTGISALCGNVLTRFLKVNTSVYFHSLAYIWLIFPVLFLHVSYFCSPSLSLPSAFDNTKQ